MPRTTVSLPEPMMRQLQRIADERGISVAAVVRELLEEKLAGPRPRPKSLGIGASGHRDTARRAGEERPVPRPWR